MDGFTRTEIETSGARIVTVHGGNGPPLLLLHGNPFTHLSWHKFAPRLAREFTVVATDLRGYGDLSKPPSQPDHANYSFRAMAQDNVEVMAALGFDKFLAAGHDRGARVRAPHVPRSSRQGARASIQDIIPQHHLFNNVTQAWATGACHWFFMIQKAPMPRTADERRPGFLHREEARQDRAGAVLLRQGGAGRIQALLPQSRDGARHVRGLSRLRRVDLATDTEDIAAGGRSPARCRCCGARPVRSDGRTIRRPYGSPTQATSATRRRCPAGIISRRRRLRKPTGSSGRSFWRSDLRNCRSGI